MGVLKVLSSAGGEHSTVADQCHSINLRFDPLMARAPSLRISRANSPRHSSVAFSIAAASAVPPSHTQLSATGTVAQSGVGQRFNRHTYRCCPSLR